MEDISAAILQLYHNPVRKTLYIENAASINPIDFVNPDGKLMMKISNDRDRVAIYVRRLEDGLHMIRAYTDSDLIVSKCFKQEWSFEDDGKGWLGLGRSHPFLIFSRPQAGFMKGSFIFALINRSKT